MVEEVSPTEHAQQIHRWLTHPKAWAWGMTDFSISSVVGYLEMIHRDPYQQAWLGSVNGKATFLIETYDPASVLLVEEHDALKGDIGMHLLVAPQTDGHISGLTSAVMNCTVRFCFEYLDARRIVVEPDVRNSGIAKKNSEAGFRVLREIEIAGKRSTLAVLDRNRFEAINSFIVNPKEDDPNGHLRPEAMLLAHRRLVAKGITEFTHERLISPEPVGNEVGRYFLRTKTSTYTFSATAMKLEHLEVDSSTIERRVAGELTPVDAQQFVVDLEDELAIPEDLIAIYLEEVASTVAGLSFRLDRTQLTSEELVHADFQTIESSMIDGHPCFFANSGRIGFGLDEFASYAPEAAKPVRLVWLAAHRRAAHLALSNDTDEASLHRYLGGEVHRRFRSQLAEIGLNPDAYLFIPVHPWQWQHKIAIIFAPDLGRDDLVYLGESADEYQAQQSIRTFFNISLPRRPYIKTALAIRNMGFQRGLSPEYMRVTPEINDWVASLVRSDSTLRSAGFDVLCEFATVGYTGDIYHRAAQNSSHTKMISALWRESAIIKVSGNERLMSMAALLHRDKQGHSLAVALIRASGLSPKAWIRAYLKAYLRPLVHCLLKYSLAFIPHGENVILVLDHAGVPQRVLMKDIGEEVAVLSASTSVPESIGRIRQFVEPREQALAIFTDIFNGVLRHLSAYLHIEGILDEDSFWPEVAAVIEQHRMEHPQIGSRLDLRAPHFDHSCMNRLQLRNTLHMVRLADPSSSLVYAGTLTNPIAFDGKDV